ncbi:MAG: exosortase H-associated membrane protein [bacterium]
MPKNQVKQFFLKILIWLPVCFFGWYYMAPTIMLPMAYLSDLFMTGVFPNAIAAIESTGYELDIVTQFDPPGNRAAAVPAGQTGQLVFTINGLLYGYGIPLFTALVLSSPGSEKIKWFRWSIGILVLILTQVWGICFDVLKTLAFQTGPEIRTQLGFSRVQIESIGLGYQFGYLILPAVTPLVLWIGFHRDFIASLAPGIVQHLSKADKS